MMFNDVHGGSNYVVSDNPSQGTNPILRLLRHHRDENGKLAYSLGGYQHNSLSETMEMEHSRSWIRKMLIDLKMVISLRL